MNRSRFDSDALDDEKLPAKVDRLLFRVGRTKENDGKDFFKLKDFKKGLNYVAFPASRKMPSTKIIKNAHAHHNETKPAHQNQ